MTYSTAQRYSDIFEIMADPYALLILDLLFDNRKQFSAEELAKEIRSTESKVCYICEKLENKGILDREDVDGNTKYSATEFQYANFIETVINRID